MILSPLVPVEKNKKSIKIKGWQELSPHELGDLVKKNNGGNVGVRLDQYAVIDPDEPAAEIFVNEWEKKGILPPTIAWKTARGFTKRLFRRPDNWPFDSHTATVPNMKLQLRSGSGVQDLIPPSYVVDEVKKFEGKYVWLPQRDPDNMEAANLPQEVLVHFLKFSIPERSTLKPDEKLYTGDKLNVEAYLIQYGVDILKIKPYKDGTLYCLRHCIFNPDHQPNDAAIFQADSGKLSYQCFHDTCQGRTWAEARLLISGQDNLQCPKQYQNPGLKSHPVPNLSYDVLNENTSPDLESTPKLNMPNEPAHLGAPGPSQAPTLAQPMQSLVVDFTPSSSTFISSEPISRSTTPSSSEQDSQSEQKKELIKALRENTLTPEQKGIIVRLIEKDHSGLPISEQVRRWILDSEEDFNRTILVKDLNLWKDQTKREAAYKAITRLKDEGVITNTGQRGYYRKVQEEARKIDFLDVDPYKFIQTQWPFRLHQLVKIFPRNLIVLAGATNAGKTSFLLEFCRLNMGNDNKIRYISTEMDDQELRDRLDYYATDMGEYNTPLEDWETHIDFRVMYRNVIDIIQPNWINIIDYYSAEGNFYDIDREFKEINKKLNKGIAIIAIQKKRGASEGVGGAFTEFLPRLVLNFDRNKLTIKKAKNMMPGINRGADGFVIKFKLAQGYKWILDQPIEDLFWWWNYHDKESELCAF